VEPGLGGPERDVEAVGHLGQGEPQVVVQDEDGALVGRKPPEAPLELVAIVDGQDVVGSPG
jgi:hypothetical protein